MILEINDRIRTRKLSYFTNFELNMKYDSIGSTFKFDFYFNPDNIEHKEMACIAHYHIAKLIDDNGELVMTGYVHTHTYNDFPERQLVSLGGYSLPGVLQDCEIPLGSPESWFITAKGYAKNIINKIWPGTLQSDGLSLRSIVEKTINPFGLQMVVDSSVADLMDEIYDETAAKEKQTAKTYICELAGQKNITVTDDKFGRIVFTKFNKNKKPIFKFTNSIPGVSMSLSFSGQGMHSHIKVFQQQDIDEEIPAIENVIENPYVFTVFRPHVAVQSSGDTGDSAKTARRILSQELKNIVLNIELDRWYLNGVIIRAGEIITVINPKVYLYNESEWLIEEVKLVQNASEKTASLKCVLPDVYSDSTPEYLFRGINLH